MADQRPICEIKLESDGSISFETLSSLSDECRIPPSVKSVDIPIDVESDQEYIKPAPKPAIGPPVVMPESTTTVETPAYTAKVGAPEHRVPNNPPQAMTPTVVMAIAAAGSVASSLATKMVQDFIKNSVKNNIKEKKLRDNKSSLENNEKSEEGHKNCAAERLSLANRIQDLEDELLGYSSDHESMQNNLNELKKAFKESQRKQKSEMDTELVEERFLEIERILKKAKLR
jgi:hypothetical protein